MITKQIKQGPLFKSVIIMLLALLTTLRHSIADDGEASLDIRFFGSSTLHGFDGKVPSQHFRLTIQEDPVTHQRLMNATVRVSVKDMTTSHPKRDRNMLKMLGCDKFVSIEGTVTDAIVPLGAEGFATLKLKIRDVENNIPVKITEWQSTKDSISFHMMFPVSLKAFGLKPPSVLGVIRVGDDVLVTCDVQKHFSSDSQPLTSSNMN